MSSFVLALTKRCSYTYLSSTDTDSIIILSLQALFAKLQQFATVAGDVLLGKEKIQKNLLARLTETVVMWLSDEQEFWGVFEDESSAIQATGLQQVFLIVFDSFSSFAI